MEDRCGEPNIEVLVKAQNTLMVWTHKQNASVKITKNITVEHKEGRREREDPGKDKHRDSEGHTGKNWEEEAKNTRERRTIANQAKGLLGSQG